MNPIVQEDIHSIIRQLGDSLYVLKDKEILLTGGCGFLGSWFVAVIDELNGTVFKDNPCKMYVVDSGIASDKLNNLANISSEYITFIRDDITTMRMKGSVDYIIHAAGIASPVYYRKYPIETIEGMAFGLVRLMKFAVHKRVESFLYFSSSEIYGNPHEEYVPTKEEYNGNVSCLGPRSCYDESKRFGETVCVSYHKVYGIPVKWVRPFNVYGPGMRIKDDRVVPKFMFQMLRGENVTVHSPGVQTRTFCYITDAMVGFFKALFSRNNGHVFNIGQSSPEIGMEQLATYMKEILPTKSEIIKIPMPKEYPTDQATRRCPDIGKARQFLGYKPKISLEEGLLRMWQWAEEELKNYGKQR